MEGFDNDNMVTNGELRIINLYIPDKNAIVFDIGANIGLWSNYVLTNKDSPVIYCFEPGGAAFQELQKNISDAVLHNCAISNHVGFSEFHEYSNLSVMNGIYKRTTWEEQSGNFSNLVKVETDTLDSFCTKNNIDYIDFVKIDTEGSELDVLEGSKQLLLGKKIKYIQFEYGGCYVDSHTTLEKAYILLKSFGYTVYRILPSSLLHIDNWEHKLENYRLSNYIGVA